jgi:hypothetical protein
MLTMRPFLCVSVGILLSLPFHSWGQELKKSEAPKYFPSDTINYSCFGCQPLPNKELLSRLDRQAKWDEKLVDRLNPSGLRLRFVKIDETPAKDGPAVARYRIYAEGAEENKVFEFVTWPIADSTVSDPRDVYVNGQGLLMIHKPTDEQEMNYTAPGDELVVAPAMGTAEPMRYVLTRRDKMMLIYGTLVPHPVLSNEKGCRLEVRLAQPGATAVLIMIDGFPAKSRIPLVLESDDVALSDAMYTNADGHAVIADFPFLHGKTQGILKASAEGPNCLPSITLPWGPAPQAAQKKP